MSLNPDGFGHNAYASKSNAGPHGLLSDATYTLASTGQEHDLTRSTSSYVQEGNLHTQLQQPATVEHLNLPEESAQINGDHQQTEDLQPQPNNNGQSLQSTGDIESLSCGQTRPPFQSYDKIQAYQQQYMRFVNDRQNLSDKDQIIDQNHNLVDQETQTSTVKVKGKQVQVTLQEVPDHKQNLVDHQTQTNTAPESEIKVNEKKPPGTLQQQIPDHNPNISDLVALWQFVAEPEIEFNKDRDPVSGQHHRIPDHIQDLIWQEVLSYFVPEVEVNDRILDFDRPEPAPAGQNQFGSANRKQETEVNNEVKRRTGFLEFGKNPSNAPIKPIKRDTRQDHITKIVRNGLGNLIDLCERVAAEPQPEGESVETHIRWILDLRQRLAEVGEILIRHPDPIAINLVTEIHLGLDCVLILGLKQEEPAADANDITEPPDNPMGLDVLSRIRKIIFGWYKNDTQSDNPDQAGSETGPAGDQYQRNSRKRRTARDEPPLIKYRRVDNSFPRYIPNEVAEDPVPPKSMADRERDKENQRQFAKRLSVFNAPTLIQQRVRNNAPNLNIDLSDDDEPLPSFGPGASHGMSSDSSSSMRSQMLYSDAVRLGQNGFPESRMNGHPKPPIRSSTLGEDSLLNYQDRSSEHEQYMALLRNIYNDKVTKRAIDNSNPPALQFMTRAPQPSATWGSILGNNKPPLSRQQQQSSPPLSLQQQQSSSLSLQQQPASNRANRDFADYAKLLDREQQKSSPPPQLSRVSSPQTITSHASTISISESSSSSSSSSSNASNAVHAIDTSAEGNAAAPQANDAGAAPSEEPLKYDPNNPAISSAELQRRLESCRFFKDNFANEFKQRMDKQRKDIDYRTELAAIQAQESREARREYEKIMRAQLFQLSVSYKPLLVIGAVDTPKDEKVAEFIPITDEHLRRVNELMNGPSLQVIVDKFGLQVSRNDIRTLLGSSWLNDEVINFYMNLLIERSERRSGELPSVYAMNTFFVPRLLQNGHDGVKRWTRKIDIFSKDIIPVPVHCNGVHWCMAIIHMRDKTIRYYDSMGKPNQGVLDALELYLRKESEDKRKQPLDTSSFKIESVPNVPQQTNGSDCGVFSCMFAEYITRDAPITFSQENMDYFRKKMIIEIADGKLWN